MGARAIAAITMLAVCGAPSLARADQPVPDASPPPAPVPTPPVPDASPPPATSPPRPPDEAWAAYDEAFTNLGRGQRDAAEAGLVQLTTRWPAHPAARQAAQRLAELEARAAARERAREDRTARGELVFWSTAGSVLLARDLCLDRCESARSTAAVYSLTVGGALGLSLLATRNGVRPAEAHLYDSAQTWGSWNALAINDGFAETRREAAISIGAQFAGLAAALGLWKTWRPDVGEVALANTGLLWGSVLSVYGQLMAGTDGIDLQTVVVVGDLALVAGALIAHEIPMSRGRTLLIDVGGVLGSLVGGLGVLSTDDERAAGAIMFTTTAAGLVLAGIATRTWDVKAPTSARLVPTRVGTPGAGAGWGAALAIDL